MFQESLIVNTVVLETANRAKETMQAIALQCMEYTAPDDMPEAIALHQSRQAAQVIFSVSAMLFGYDKVIFEKLSPERFFQHLTVLRADVYEELCNAGLRYRVYVTRGKVHAELYVEELDISATAPISIDYGDKAAELMSEMDWRLSGALN